MKEILHQIGAISMAFMLLFSTMSFTVDMHYCGGQLIDFSLFEAVDSCAMRAQASKSSSECALMKMDCCTDVEIVKEGQDDLKISFHQFTFEHQTFITAFAYSYINLFEGLDENNTFFKEYAPPPLIRDIQVLDQTFLI